MKKAITTSFLAIILSCSASFAQLGIGLKGGLNLASVSNLGEGSSSSGAASSSNKTKPKIGMHLGGYINFSFSDMLGFQPELLFTMKGYVYESTVTVLGTTSSSTSSATINYIELPLQLRINPSEKIHILGGPYIGFLAGAKSKTESTFGNSSSTSTSSSTDGLTSMDFGLALGLGFKADNGFVGGVKYSRGFSSIFDPDSNSSNVNSVFQLFLGFEFGGR